MKGLLFLIGSLLLVSCAVLPAIRPVAGLAEKNIMCPSPFLTEKIRLIHAIEVRAAGQVQTVMIGVTMTNPVTRTISCALMSAEGMALFEAVSGPDGLKVSRALPPFDAADFARKMMDDIDLIFLAPQGALTEKGVFVTGETVCRRHKEPGGWIDVLQGHGGPIHIRRYSEGGRLQRSVTLAGGSANPYSTIDLQASERVDYSLIMTLIESETVRDEPQRKE
ncbi:MAG: hypothetical protein EHM66_01505 [Deltaproteobacteria bacterium]|nr:MAG: hypothetical protein EHM66_01505 [Deltaproteobacteria bacterium]